MKPILNIENLTKIYGNVPSQTKALNGITFQVMPGEFLGIMGSSGSGKSTLLNCIVTVIQPTGGSIQVEGVNLQALKGRTLADYRGKKVGYLFQNFELLDNLTGRENILLPTSLHGIPEKESNQRLSQLAKYLEIRLENIGTPPSQLRHHLQDASVELLSAFISTAKLMEDHTVLDEQNTPAKAGSIRIMGHHQDRCLFVAVQSGQFFHNVSCILGIQSTGRLVGKNHSGVQD